MSKKNQLKVASRAKRKAKFKKKLSAVREQRPRLVVYRSNRFMYAQVIDDKTGSTLCQANSREKEVASSSRKNLEAAKSVGKLVAERLLKKDEKHKGVVFDRNGYGYHGRIQALADGAREAGLQF